MANTKGRMKCFTAAALISSALLVGAAQPRLTRVPPPGIAIAEKDRAGLRAGADALAEEIKALRSSPQREWLPDVEVFHKAVDWALRYDEFYRSNEVALARGLLKTGMERAKQLREGNPQWLSATGLVVRGYVSKIDGSVQPYGLVVPASYRAADRKSHRLDVWLHGRDNHLTELKFISDRQKSYGEFAPADTFVLHPYGRYCNAFKFAGEMDVFEAMEHVRRSYGYRIDDNRIALRGFSMGGAGVWHLGAHHPNRWAVAAPGAGFAETAEYQKIGTNRARFPAWEQTLWQLYDATDYAANFANLPVISYAGLQDTQRQSGDVMERAMKAEGLMLLRVWGTNIGHKYTPESKIEINRFVDDAMDGRAASVRELPARIHFTTRTLRYPDGVGVRVLGLGEHWKRADVIVDRDARAIQTTNVTSFELRSSVDRFTIDGQSVTVTNPRPQLRAYPPVATFSKGEDGKWSGVRAFTRPSPGRKSPGLQGPIDDAFYDSFLVVRPTAKSPNEALNHWVTAQLAKATNDWRAQFRGDAPVKDDSQVTDADMAAHNLILFGDPKSNKLLARIADKLPIRWEKDSIEAGAKKFAATSHAPIFIFPNPLNPRRYVVVNSGFTFAAAGNASNAQQTPKLPDWAVVEIESGAVVLADFFNEEWGLK
jgi:pimeloyl-ACP methyl ester carboxylesterase